MRSVQSRAAALPRMGPRMRGVHLVLGFLRAWWISLQQPEMVYQVFGAVYGAGVAARAVPDGRLSPSQHLAEPAAPADGALAGRAGAGVAAGTSLLLVAILLPLLLMLAGQHG